MKRLTNPEIDYSAVGVVDEMRTAIIAGMLCRLAAYEDTGLEPEEFKESADFVLEMNKKLKLYLDAEQEGRLVVLPCKVGEHLYATECGSVREVIADLFHYDGHCLEITYHYNHFGYVEGMGVIGKTVFLSREDAEKALKGVSEDA